MSSKTELAYLIDEGIMNVAGKQRKDKGEIYRLIGEALG
jgi:hypothetical protein